MLTFRPIVLLAPLLSTLATVATAQQPAVPPVFPSERTLRVEGTGEVKVTPDEAFIDLAVETLAPTAKEAAAENARKMDAVVSALVRAGIPRNEIETRNYAVYPEYTPPVRPEEAPRLRGYRVSNMVTAHVRELERVGGLLDTALAAGVNRVDMVRFGLSHPEEVQGEALQEAVERARRSAQVLASALGVRLGPVLDVSTVSEPPRFFPAQRLEMAQAGGNVPSTPIQPQEQTVQARVSIVFTLEGPGTRPPQAGAARRGPGPPPRP